MSIEAFFVTIVSSTLTLLLDSIINRFRERQILSPKIFFDNQKTLLQLTTDKLSINAESIDDQFQPCLPLNKLLHTEVIESNPCG